MIKTNDPRSRLPGRRPAHARRGVLLLVVLSMLTLFMLLGTTYMVVTSRARATARAFARAAEASHSAQSTAGRRFVDEAFLAVARGPVNHEDANLNDALDAGEDRNANGFLDPAGFPVGEDLLGDKYGYASRSATLASRLLLTGTLGTATAINPNPNAAGNLVLVPIAWSPSSAASAETAAAALGGRVITFTLPDFTWSTRILRARDGGGSATGVVVSLVPVPGCRGTTLAELNAAIARAPKTSGSPPQFIINTREFVGLTGNPQDTNESYDGFDAANPFLAQIVQAQPYTPASSGTITTGSCARASYQSAPPSPTNPPQVDNDGDGVADSFWLDFGFPVINDPSGAAYKPRAAVLVLDLDGRLNVNAHGSYAEAMLLSNSAAFQWPTAAPQLSTAMTGTAFSRLPVGSGYGPAEVRLGDLFVVGGNRVAAGQALQLLVAGTSSASTSAAFPGALRPAVTGTSIWGRYGDSVANPQPGVSGTDDTLSVIQDQQRARARPGNGPQTRRRALSDGWRMNPQGNGIPLAQWQADPDSYNAPPDLGGRMRVYADTQPGGDGVVARMRYAKPVVSGTHWWQGDTTDDPYEIRLERRSAADSPFDPDELERVLRIYDWDAPQLPSRLAALLGRDAERLRLLLTSESWDTTAVVGTARKKVEDAIQATSPLKQTEVFAPEVLTGRRFDINRPVQTDAEKTLFARHLFSLLWALLDKTNDADALQAAAQWAVNVVDFRDPDSSATRFAYDKTPQDGWNPAATDVVWGLERPELLITEALAWQSGTGSDGGVYVVVHHPWSSKALAGSRFVPVANNTDAPAWVDPDAIDSTLDTVPPTNVLNLDARGGGDPDSPVWRLRVGGAWTSGSWSGGTIVRLDAPLNGQAQAAEFWSKPQNNNAGVNRSVPPDGSVCIYGESTKPTNGAVDVDTAFPSPAGQLKIDMQGGAGASLKPGSATNLTVVVERLADPSKKFAAGSNDYLEADRVDVQVVDRTPDPVTAQPLQPYEKQARSIQANAPGPFWRRHFDPSAAAGKTDPMSMVKPTTAIRVPSLPWLNRPLISVVELGLVPARGSHDWLDGYKGFTGNGMLDEVATTFDQRLGVTTNCVANLLEATTVPSRFAGIGTTVDEYPAGEEVVGCNDPTTDPAIKTLPINQFSAYREPGRVNLNTVSDQRVWEATVLRGGTATSGTSTFGWTNSSLGHPGAAAQPAMSMLQMLALKGGSTSKTVVVDLTDPGPDPAGNPQFQYLTAGRLANVATTRSHVFAVWVTVGYFDPATGQELGADTGDIRRHRGFYIFDRSIPVAYETGKDHNVRDAILLRRIIQ